MKLPELPPLYLPWAAPGEHRFAQRLRQFEAEAPSGSVLILHAPTGAGKTRAILESAKRSQGVLLCAPTNALVAEVEAEGKARGLRTFTWTSAALGKKGVERHWELVQQAYEADLIVANPDILHLFRQHEDVARLRVSPSGFGMKVLRLLVFDEYHAYDERVLASVLMELLKARHVRGHGQRFVFMSATPDDALPTALDRLGIPYAEERLEEPSSTPLPPEDGRLVKGPLRVEVTSEPILASLPEKIPQERTLFIFSTFLKQQAAVRRLKERGLQEGDAPGQFVEITGRKTKADPGQRTWEKAPLLLGTSKVEVGLNIDGLERVVMEPGWNEQQFWQRFGRAARGRSGVVRLHFEDYPPDKLAPLEAATSYDELSRAVRTLLQPQTRHVTTILRFVGAYAAVYRANTHPSHDRDAVHPDKLPPSSREALHLVETILRAADADDLATLQGGSRHWRDLVRRSLRGIRGRALEETAIYAWTPEETVRESILHLLTRTDAARPLIGEPWQVDNLLDRPKDACVHYTLPGGESHAIQTRGRLDHKDLQRLAGALHRKADHLLDGEPTPFWNALADWLRMVPPDEIPPREVTPDDRFL